MTQANVSFSSILEPYKQEIDRLLQANIESFGKQNVLRDACEYALTNGGKRFRPALVLMIAKALGYGIDVSQAALGVEYFHTASLIADDLPCMDNDYERRKKPTVHTVYGESVALLASYALIAAGYRCLVQNTKKVSNSQHPLANKSDYLCVLALENATYNTGICGATGGQLLDLIPPDFSLSTLSEIIDKKTVTLFEISFVYGWIFGGGDLDFLPLIKRGAGHFGRAFQIADDLNDMEQDLINDRAPNIANALGKKESISLFYKEINQFENILDELSLKSEDLQALIQTLVQQVVD
jgi:geranylgeranyl diphosphate synthase type II